MIGSKSVRLLVASLSLAGAANVSAQASAAAVPSLADWRSDLSEIVRDIRTLHPEPFARTGRMTFMRSVTQFETALPSLTEEQRVAGLMRLVASLGDGHTYLEMNNPRYARWYPVRFYQFNDGL